MGSSGTMDRTCLLHWQADSLPLSHQGSSVAFLLCTLVSSSVDGLIKVTALQGQDKVILVIHQLVMESIWWVAAHMRQCQGHIWLLCDFCQRQALTKVFPNSLRLQRLDQHHSCQGLSCVWLYSWAGPSLAQKPLPVGSCTFWLCNHLLYKVPHTPSPAFCWDPPSSGQSLGQTVKVKDWGWALKRGPTWEQLRRGERHSELSGVQGILLVLAPSAVPGRRRLESRGTGLHSVYLQCCVLLTVFVSSCSSV